MLSPYLPPQDDPAEIMPPRRGVLWVAQAAFALLAIAAWLFLMLHVLLIVRAEYRLQHLLKEASAFSELPEVSRRELARFVQHRTMSAGWDAAVVAITPRADNRNGWQVAAMSVPGRDLIPPRLHGLAERFGAPPRVRVYAQQATQHRLF